MVSKGQLLISDISLAEDSIFRRSVILICDNANNDSPMGFILNKPLKIYLSNIISKVSKKFKVHFGGPVSSDTLFCIHKSELKLKSSKHVTKDLRYGCDLNEVVMRVENGELNEENIMFFLGYSGWTNDQLLEELSQSCWKISKKTSKIIFEKSEENLWNKMAKKINGGFYIWSNAPENIKDN